MTTIIFGDSFIGPFKLLNDNNLNLYKYKGATINGLTKENNKNRINIIKILKQINTPKCIIFNFGQVDLYFTYYYKKFVQNKKFLMNSIIKKYIEFINNLDCNNCNKIVFAVYPTTIQDKYVFDTLLQYGILLNNQINLISDYTKNRVSNFKFRYKLYIKFNKLLEKYCNLYKINFIKLDNEILNNDNTLKLKFIDPISKYNIHLLWEPLIPIIISKLLNCNIKEKYKRNLSNSFNKFLNKKKNEFKIL